jgi:phytoene dehydrogenase-like protein
MNKRIIEIALEVVVFEANDTIGGRLRHINIHGVNLEVGGGVYFYQNFFIRFGELNQINI